MSSHSKASKGKDEAPQHPAPAKPRRPSLAGPGSRRVSMAPPGSRRVSMAEGVRFAFQQPGPRPSGGRRSISLWSDNSDQEFIERGLRAMEEKASEPKVQDRPSGAQAPRREGRMHVFFDKWEYRHRKSKYFGASRKVANYWRKVMLMYETVYEEMRFPIMPEKAGSLNHLSGQLWLVTFLMKDLFDDEFVEAPEVNKLSELYARAVYEAVLTEEFVRAFVEPLKAITDFGATRFGEMKLAIFGSEENSTSKALLEIELDIGASGKGRISTLINNELEGTSGDPGSPTAPSGRRPSDPVKPEPKLQVPESIKTTLLRGSRIQRESLFDHLEVYTRTTAKRKWHLFGTFSYERKLEIATEAVTAVTESLIKLRRLLKPVKRYLKGGAARRTCITCCPRLVAHLDTMATSLQTISLRGKPRSPKFMEMIEEDEPKMITVLRRTELYIQSIVNNGNQIVTQLMEVMALSELCYLYMVDGLHIPMKPCEEVVKKLYKNYRPKPIFAKKDFEADDFFKTRYPDVLRKVPVIVHRTELGLHKCTEQSLINIMATRESQRKTRDKKKVAHVAHTAKSGKK